MGSNSVLTTLIQDAILKLCTQNVLFDASLEIDGIICISPGQESKEIVVKMHRTIMKPTPEPEVFQPEPSPKSTPHRRNRNQQAHSSNIESDTFPAQTSNISFDEMPKHDTYQDESGATAYFPDEQQQYDTTPSKQSRKRRQPQTPTDTSSEEKYIKVEPGEGEILVEEPTNMPAAGESNDSYSDTSQGYFRNPRTSATYQGSHQDQINMSHQEQSMSHQEIYSGSVANIREPDAVCSTCLKVFPTKRCLEYHIQVTHVLFCDVCNMRIVDDPSVENHGMMHIGEKAYHCELCFKLFTSESGLKKHSDKDGMCHICNKFVPRSIKASHMKAHSKKK